MKRARNFDGAKLRRTVKKNRISEGVYSGTLLYVKFLIVWMSVLMADFLLEFRLEFLWPFWLLLRSVYDSFRYQGFAFSAFFVCIAVTSDMVCFLFIPVQWLFFLASTYVWVQYVWHADRGICLPSVCLWCLFIYIEASVRLKELRNIPFTLDLCRPFAAHCIGYPVVTLGFGVKSYVGYKFRLRRQREVSKENEFYMQLLDDALPQDSTKALPARRSSSSQSSGPCGSGASIGAVGRPISEGAISNGSVLTQQNGIGTISKRLNSNNHVASSSHATTTAVSRKGQFFSSVSHRLATSKPQSLFRQRQDHSALLQTAQTASPVTTSGYSVEESESPGTGAIMPSSGSSSSHSGSGSRSSAATGTSSSRRKGSREATCRKELANGFSDGFTSPHHHYGGRGGDEYFKEANGLEPTFETLVDAGGEDYLELPNSRKGSISSSSIKASLASGTPGALVVPSWCSSASSVSTTASLSASMSGGVQRSTVTTKPPRSGQSSGTPRFGGKRGSTSGIDFEDEGDLYDGELESSGLASGGAKDNSHNSMPTAQEHKVTNKDLALILELDMEKLKKDLRASRANEEALYSQVQSLTQTEKASKSEVQQLKDTNEQLQNKLHNLVRGKQQDKQNIATLEKRLVEEQNKRGTTEQQLQSERKQKKQDEAAAAKALAAATALRADCTDACKSKRRELEVELKNAKREKSQREDRMIEMESEMQSLIVYKNAHADTEVLMKALSNIQAKNAQLENSLSAETRIKLDLFSALGEAKRQLGIAQGEMGKREQELDELRRQYEELLRSTGGGGSSGRGSGAVSPAVSPQGGSAGMSPGPPPGFAGTLAVGPPVTSSLSVQHGSSFTSLPSSLPPTHSHSAATTGQPPESAGTLFLPQSFMYEDCSDSRSASHGPTPPHHGQFDLVTLQQLAATTMADGVLARGSGLPQAPQGNAHQM